MVKLLEGVPPYREEDIQKYISKRWWRGMTLGDILDRAADMHPDKEAFVDKINRYTYGQAREKVDKLAISLMQLGIKPLDRVLIQLPNWNEFVFAFFACQKIGAITVLLIERYRHFEIDRLINLTGATAWIVPKSTKKIDFIPIVNDVLKDHPEINKVITVRGTVDQQGFYSMEALIDAGELTPENLAELASRNPDPMQVAHMGPTGGTTGAPKIVPRLHNSLVCGVESCSMSWDQHCEDVNLLAGTIGHDLSFTKGFLGAVLTQGKVIFQSNLDIESICKTIEKEKVTTIVWVPTLAKRMVQYDDLHKYDLSSLRKMHSGGGASHPDLVRDVIDKLDMKFYNGYGGTEGMTCITRTIDDYHTVCCTVGRPTFPHDHYKVVDLSGKELPPGQQGELLVKGPCVFSGYFNDPKENSKAFDRDGYFKTGDLATVDQKGYISLTGRIKEMINRGGESISSTEIEKLISRHPAVAAVAVVAMPDPMMGERVCAYIELKGNNRVTFEDIITFLKNQKASVLHLPERIEFIDKMPLTATNKLNKRALRSDIEDKLSKEAIA
jgi:2,3-dihydroxybenzoate-AMP ligase/mycobactin salicyl-AMP ligase